MAARRSTAERKAELQKKLANTRAQLKRIEVAEAERIAKLALKAGLADSSVPDEALIEAFRDLAARFPYQSTPQTAANGATDGTIV